MMPIIRANRPRVIVERSAAQNPVIQVSPRVIVTGGSGGGGGGTPGANGREVEFRSSGGYIQWHYVGDSNWLNLVATSALKGDTGTSGANGADGAPGVGIVSVSQISGTHAPGTTDTYRMTLTSGSTFDFTVYNGANGADGAGATSHTHSAADIASGTLSPDRLPVATTSANGVAPLASQAEVTTGTNNTKVVTPATLKTETTSAKARANHTGTQSADTIVDGTTNKVLTAAEKTKLGTVATGATANATDALLRDRSTHTGQQPSSSISDFAEAAQDAVAAMLAGASGVTLTYNDASNSLTITGSGAGGGGVDVEAVRDAIGVALVGTAGINVVVNDAADTITLSTTATQNDTDANLKNRANHTGQQASTTISDFAEAARDAVGAALSGTGNVNVVVNDAADTITISTTATVNDTDANLKNRANHTGQQASTTISDFSEAVQDVVGATLEGTSGVVVTYNDTTNKVTIAGPSFVDSGAVFLKYNWTTSTWPARPTTTAQVFWVGGWGTGSLSRPSQMQPGDGYMGKEPVG